MPTFPLPAIASFKPSTAFLLLGFFRAGDNSLNHRPVQPVENVLEKEFMYNSIAWWTSFLSETVLVDTPTCPHFLIPLAAIFLDMDGDEHVRCVYCCGCAFGLLSVLREECSQCCSGQLQRWIGNWLGGSGRARGRNQRGCRRALFVVRHHCRVVAFWRLRH